MVVHFDNLLIAAQDTLRWTERGVLVEVVVDIAVADKQWVSLLAVDIDDDYDDLTWLRSVFQIKIGSHPRFNQKISSFQLTDSKFSTQ